MRAGRFLNSTRRTAIRGGIALVLLLCFAVARADPVQLARQGLRLNGEFETAGAPRDSGKPVFLLVHGTWAYDGMEIIRALQSVLAEYGYPSLAITLSLGLDDRTGPLGCDAPVLARHDAAVAEIAAWLQMLKTDGWPRVVLTGHSRGGAQAALFQHASPDPTVQRMLLLGPMVWRAQAVAAEYDARSDTALSQVLSQARAAMSADGDPGSDAALLGPYPLLYCDSVRATPGSFFSYYDPAVPKHTPALVAQLDLPVDIYLGTEDGIARWSPEDRAAATIRAGVTVHDVQGADHFFRDLYLYDVVEDFLSRLP